jgi:hypothetical protein
MQDRDDSWGRAGADTRAEVREIFARQGATPPESTPDRFDPLPNFLMLPIRGWRRLSPRGRIVLAALVAIGLAALAVAWPQVERDKRAGAEERAKEAADRREARRRELVEDQRPRRATLPVDIRQRIRDAGGLTSTPAAALAGSRLETAIARDIRSRIASGKLSGPLLGTSCDPVRVRTASGASYNCFALTNRRRFRERTIESGYRFSARAELGPGTLTWCKENPRPLHPTSYVITVPISPECRSGGLSGQRTAPPRR